MLDTNPELDIDLKEIGSFLKQVQRPNMNYLEHVNSPHIIITSPEHAELRDLSNACISKKVYQFYVGFVDKVLKDAERTGIIKRHLYAIRLLMSGAHLFRTGEIVSDINVLNERARQRLVAELVQAKKAGELVKYTGDLDKINSVTNSLRADFEKAYAESKLPSEPGIETTRALNSYLIEFRRKN